MIVDVTFRCGHNGEIQVFGTNKERERKIWVAEHQLLCEECNKKARHELIEKEKKLDAEKGLCELEGSEKQISWAIDLRREFLGDLDDIARKMNSDDQLKMKKIKNYLSEIKSAKWWIDNRFEYLTSVVRDIYSKIERDDAAK